MPFTTPATIRRAALALSVLAATACTGADEPHELAYRLDAAPGRSYATTLVHEMAFDMGDHGAEGTRNLHAVFTIEANGGPGAGIVRLDSARASIVWGQAQQRIDTRGVVGRGFGVTLADVHAAPAYAEDDVPVIDMGERGGGAVPASLLVGYAFPSLPDGPVTVGTTWTSTTAGSRLHGFMTVHAEITTTHRVTGTESLDGTRCVRVESESSGTLSGGQAGDLALDFDGTVSGTARWCFDADAGALVEFASEETATGGAPWPNGVTARIDQSTRVEVRPAAGSAT